ncbi:CBS domain-containing protein [Pedobacter sp. BS3]|uniref:CBS domain-containing protein n=1 Tax=Pedobacter sp. BS3 TaxID=2567937 RepID=UPI0011ED1423|nr:CBS domain-containing protein [Pedobacter sp. BS3]TZF82573.1 CBS domain-containing protein [Pedobacter sp. BS3]
MNISELIRYDFKVVKPYVSINSVRQELITYKALAVIDDDTNIFLGVLTPFDVTAKPHNLVIDCLTEKTILTADCSVTHVLQTMEDGHSEVLPVFKEQQLDGLIFKKDIVDFLSSRKIELEERIATEEQTVLQQHQALQKQNQLLKEIIHTQCHKLRRPVANVLGLMEIIDYTSLSAENQRTIALLKESVEQLDDVIKDVVRKINDTDNDITPDFPDDSLTV